MQITENRLNALQKTHLQIGLLNSWQRNIFIIFKNLLFHKKKDCTIRDLIEK